MAVIGGRIPVPAVLAKHSVQVEDSGEWLDKVLWDTQLYTDNATTQLTFFTGLPATIEAGNLDQAGMVGGNRLFVIRQLAVGFRSNAAFDLTQLARNGVLRLFIGAKDYGEWIISKLPQAGGIQGAVATTNAATVQLANHGRPDPRCGYTLTRPLLIGPQTNFRVVCEWPVAQNISANVNVRVFLKGELGRFIQ